VNRTTTSLLVAAAGGATSLLLGSGLLALTSDSVTSPGNEFASGTFTPTSPAAHEVRAGLLAPGTDPCDTTTTAVHDGPISAVLAGHVLNLSGGSLTQDSDFCIRNDGTATGRLRVAVVNVVGTELGACETTETSAGDTTCGIGATGELANVVTWTFLRSSGPQTSTSCVSSAPSAFTGTTSAVIDASLAPGETCRMRLAVQVPASATEDQKLRAQTDRVRFDIVFTLEDPTVP
jgi:hypothetical protein